MSVAVRALALASLLVASTAHADEPAVARAGDANLETNERRKTIMVSLALGGSFTLGLGVDDVVGNGGAGSLRLARVMTPKWLLSIETSNTALVHKAEATMGSPTYINNATGLMVGGQYYVGPSFWVRGATGLAVYAAKHTALDKDKPAVDKNLVGVGGLLGAGIEFARYHHVSIGVEVFSMMLVPRMGGILTNAFLLDFNFY